MNTNVNIEKFALRTMAKVRYDELVGQAKLVELYRDFTDNTYVVKWK